MGGGRRLWRSHERRPPGLADCLHVETHVAEGRDVFVTDDEALLTMCRRLRDEHRVPVAAARLADVLD